MASNQPYQPKHLTCRTQAIPDPTLYTDNENVDPSADTSGALYVAVVTNIIPPAPETFIYTNFFASDGTLDVQPLITVNGFNPSGSVIYVQFFLNAPSSGSAPDINVLLVPGGTEFSWTPSYPLIVGDGYWAVSSTPDTYTPLATSIWLHAEGGTP